jgi:hypothetical protein
MGLYPPGDAWCESIVSYDGYWTVVSGPAGTSVVLSDDRIVGDYSIAIPPFTPGYNIDHVDFYFNFIPGLEFDFRKVWRMDFWVKLGDCIGDNWCWEEGFDLFLMTNDNNYAKRRVFISRDLANIWVPIEIEAGPEAIGWEIVGDFDWSYISRIQFSFKRIIPPGWWPPPPIVGSRFVRLDGILLHIKEEFSGITVRSQPISGVPISLNTVKSDVTPITWWITPSVRTISIAETYGGYTFKAWEDGSTSAVRTVDVTTPGVYTFTASYEALPSPPPSPVWRLGYWVQYLMRLIQTMVKRR